MDYYLVMQFWSYHNDTGYYALKTLAFIKKLVLKTPVIIHLANSSGYTKRQQLDVSETTLRHVSPIISTAHYSVLSSSKPTKIRSSGGTSY